jgi:hypothetical protein
MAGVLGLRIEVSLIKDIGKRRGVFLVSRKDPFHMRRELTIGDVCEIETPSRLAYVQYTHDDPGMGQLVRVLPGLFAARRNVRDPAHQQELYFVFYVLKNALSRGQARFVSNEPVPEWAKTLPTMRHGTWDNSCWFIGDGSIEFSPQNIPRFLKVK